MKCDEIKITVRMLMLVDHFVVVGINITIIKNALNDVL